MGKRVFRAESVYNNLMKMAKSYGCDKNALFVAAAHQYQVQQTVIERIRVEIEEEERVVVTKEYVPGAKNAYISPLIKELPKHSESANKTAATMVAIIEALGHEAADGQRLEEFKRTHPKT